MNHLNWIAWKTWNRTRYYWPQAQARRRTIARLRADRRERIEQAIHGLTTEANRLRQTLNDDGPR